MHHGLWGNLVPSDKKGTEDYNKGKDAEPCCEKRSKMHLFDDPGDIIRFVLISILFTRKGQVIVLWQGVWMVHYYSIKNTGNCRRPGTSHLILPAYVL